MSSGVRLEGFDEFRERLTAYPKKVQRVSAAIVTDLALKWKQLAVQSAPVDQSKLRQGISSQVTSKEGNVISAEVFSPAFYSRFIEFGTKGKKVVPADLVSYEGSLEYKKSGNYAQFIEFIYAWVKRKGIGATYNVKTRRKNRQTQDEYKQIAEAIAYSIMKKGINPQPFFFIHKAGIEQELKARLKEVMDA